MSATVYITCKDGTFMARDVPSANHAQVDGAGRLLLSTRQYGEHAGLFKQWDHVVIDQRWIRGHDGKFVSKENH